MAKALIIHPDPDTPGSYSLTELWNLEAVWHEEASGVLVVQAEEGVEPTYYAPGAWHSYTRGSERLMP